MDKTIILLSEAHSEEITPLTRAFTAKGYTLVRFESASHYRDANPDALPAAFVSCGACTVKNLMECFALLPLGTGERIPFFQQLNGDTIDSKISSFPVSGFFPLPLQMSNILTMLAFVEQNQVVEKRLKSIQRERDHLNAEMAQLVSVGTALSSEHDLTRLLETILSKCRYSVNADAGSIYIRERSIPGGPLTDSLLFVVAQNDTVIIADNPHYRLPINAESIAGYVALTGKPLRIDDVAEIDDAAPYKPSRSFQKQFEYPIKSMLTVPLINLRKEVVGVLQLMNRKVGRNVSLQDSGKVATLVKPFSEFNTGFVLSVAQLAAVSVERAQLHENITSLFEGFLNASITSVDERDRVTSGHSRRVMRYAMAFVDAAERQPDHPYYELCSPPSRRRQFQFAALLHDIGKIGVPEFVLTKELRLPRDELALLHANLDYIGFAFTTDPESVDWDSKETIESDREFLREMNTRGYITNDERARLKELGKKTFVDYRGKRVSLLSAYALEALCIERGNLTPLERELVSSHAQSTHRILSMIPWTEDLIDVPLIAAQHHERIDGSGYPQGIRGEEMPLESKILAVIDVYEALVSQNRPYKPRMPVEKALSILESEVAAGHFDGDVVRFFVDNNIHLLYCQDRGNA